VPDPYPTPLMSSVEPNISLFDAIRLPTPTIRVAPNCTLDHRESRYLHNEVSNSGSKARESPAEAAVAVGTDSQRFR
jgi:hypothetical protein